MAHLQEETCNLGRLMHHRHPVAQIYRMADLAGLCPTMMVQCGAVWCSVVQCGAVRCSVVQYGAEWCSVVEWSAVWYSALQCNVV